MCDLLLFSIMIHETLFKINPFFGRPIEFDAIRSDKNKFFTLQAFYDNIVMKNEPALRTRITPAGS